MDVPALRREREVYTEKRTRLNGELDVFILSNMDGIREALEVHEAGVFKVSEDELLTFVRYKILRFVSRVKEEKARVFSDGINNSETVEYLDKLLKMEHCYKKFMDSEEADAHTDAYVDLRTGVVDVVSSTFGECRLDLNLEESEHKTLEGLFSKKFHLRIGERSMERYVVMTKLDVGLEVVRALYSRSLADIRKLTSYSHYKGTGIPVFVDKADKPGEEVLNEVRLRVEEEINDMVRMDFDDEKKAHLVSYLLVLFNGVANTVNLGYFDSKETFYVLEWTKMDR